MARFTKRFFTRNTKEYNYNEYVTCRAGWTLSSGGRRSTSGGGGECHVKRGRGDSCWFSCTDHHWSNLRRISSWGSNMLRGLQLWLRTSCDNVTYSPSRHRLREGNLYIQHFSKRKKPWTTTGRTCGGSSRTRSGGPIWTKCGISMLDGLRPNYVFQYNFWGWETIIM